MRTLWYMGAKTRLTDTIQAAVRRAAPRGRSVCDLMSGTASVSTALCGRYRVLANDVQAYAQAVAAAYLEHDPASRAILRDLDPERDLGAAYRRNRDALLEQLGPAAALEDGFLGAFGLEVGARDRQERPEHAELFRVPEQSASKRRLPRDAKLRAGAYRSFALQSTPTYCEASQTRATGAFRAASDLFQRQAVLARRADPSLFPYHLCSSYYPNVYLGIRQAIDLDSLRYAIDQLRGRGAPAKRRHYLAALLHAASVTTSATSHFCQPRGLVRDAEVLAVLQRRSVSIPSRVLAFSDAIRATCEAADPRPGSRANCADWRGLYASGGIDDVDVVYADPPYTADNYSRFYHVLEVLTRYDYPSSRSVAGRRPRAVTRSSALATSRPSATSGVWTASCARSAKRPPREARPSCSATRRRTASGSRSRRSAVPARRKPAKASSTWLGPPTATSASRPRGSCTRARVTATTRSPSSLLIARKPR